jgi:4-hydroxythreonine-4-phosphate dehydrogenase
MKKKPIIAVSLGDPAGIGPEVTAKALTPALLKKADFILVGDPKSLPGKLKAKAAWNEIRGRWKFGQPSKGSGVVAAASVRTAAGLVQTGEADALVTAPLSKEALGMAGEKFPGHTEMLADLAGLKSDQVGMMLVGGGLRVFLVTRHEAIKKALARLNPRLIQDATWLVARGLRERFGIRKPRLALAAMNPHAGEAGRFGTEEKQLLTPVVKSFAGEKSFSLSGPWPGDTVFVKAVRGQFDAVVCLTHDQGLIPLKLLAFDTGVNVTLGLPFIRTSPDHGTAYDIAGKSLANPSSMVEAIKLALDLVSR